MPASKSPQIRRSKSQCRSCGATETTLLDADSALAAKLRSSAGVGINARIACERLLLPLRNRPMLDRFRKYLRALSRLLPGEQHAVNLRAVLCPLLDLVEVALIRDERIIDIRRTNQSLDHAFRLTTATIVARGAWLSVLAQECTGRRIHDVKPFAHDGGKRRRTVTNRASPLASEPWTLPLMSSPRLCRFLYRFRRAGAME